MPKKTTRKKNTKPSSSGSANPVGRPTVRTPEMDRKIDEVAAYGASVEEIAYYCGIHRDTLYDWMSKDKELSDRIQHLQQRPILAARQTIIKALNSPDNAWRFLERKRKDEFSTRQEVTGKDGAPLLPERKNAIIKALKGII